MAFGLQRASLEKYMKNTTWLLAEKVVSMGLMFVTGIWVMRYFGASINGVWSYILGYVVLFMTVPSLGTKHLLIRELSDGRHSTASLMGTGFMIHTVGGVLSVLLIAIGLFFPGKSFDAAQFTYRQIVFYILLHSSIYLMQGLYVLEYYFYAKIKGKYVSIGLFAKTFVSCAMKVAGILLEMDLSWFVWGLVIEHIALFVAYILLYRKQRLRLRDWRFEWPLAKLLLKEGAYYIVVGVSITFFMGIDQVMIPRVLGDYAANGLYGAATRLSLPWSFVPQAIGNSLWPAIVNARKLGESTYRDRMVKFMAMMCWMSLALALFTTLTADYWVGWLLKAEFEGAVPILKVHIWTAVFIFIGTGTGRYFMAEQKPKINMYPLLLAGLLNICLNIALIKAEGAIGAAHATLIAYALGYYVFLFFHKEGRDAQKLVHQGLVYPLIAGPAWVRRKLRT